jgi:hypothetical protein
MDIEEDLEESKDCLKFVKAQVEFGMHYLEEGAHEFGLNSGKILRVFASSYTPEFNGYAFAYTEDEDRFNARDGLTVENIDIVTTHGPPSSPNHTNYTLDAHQEG